MTQPAHKNEQTGSAALDRIQDNVRGLIGALRLVPFLFGGKLISIEFTGAGNKTVVHGLGRPAAFFVARYNYLPGSAGVMFAEGDQTGLDTDSQLSVAASAACMVDLWMYPRASQPVPQ